jgi:putative DNA primase/helicase
VKFQQGQSPLLAAALEYARAGIAVFPLQPKGKMPLFPSVHPGSSPEAVEARERCKPPVCGHVGHGVWDATTDPAIITAWWTAEPHANIGIAAGQSGLLVVDIDTKVGKRGAQTLAALEGEYGRLPRTKTIRTWSGGLHYFFRMPEPPLRNTTGTEKAGLGPDIDTRGEGGYVVAAPSVILQGDKEGAYSVLVDAPPVALPSWVIDKLTKPKRVFTPPGRRSAVLPSGERVNTTTGVVFPAAPAGPVPPGLLRKLQTLAKEIEDLKVGDPATQPVNDRALWLGHYVPHLLAEDQVRTALTSAIDTWEDGHDKGYRAMETGLRDGMADPWPWEERRSFTNGRTDVRPSGLESVDAAPQGDSGLLPPPYVPDEVVDHLLPKWQQDGLLTLRNWRNDWMRWRTTHWRAQDRASIRAEIYPLLKGRKYRDGQGSVKPWGADRNKVANLLEILESVTYLDQDVTPGSWFDGDGPSGIIAMRNGLLSMRTRELHPHTPRYFNISSLPFEYDPAAPQPAEFLKFLASIWENDRQSIQTFLEWGAYVLSGRTDLQKMLLLIGPKRSGKGTLARIMTALVGKENVGGPSLADFGKQFGLEDLVDKPLAIIGDARMPSSGEREILGNLLSISGEDTIRADRKHRDAWVGRLPTRITILSNELPSFADSSGAIASRFVILRMTKSFIGREDKDLEQRLMAELPGILNMVLDAGQELERRGHLVEPESSETARSILSDTTSPIEVFLEECSEENPDPEAATPVEWLWWAWQDWCLASGRSTFVGTKEGFAKRLLSARPGVTAHIGLGSTAFRFPTTRA